MTMTTLLDQAVCARLQESDRVLVVGVGDEGYRDDGVGPAVVRLLCGRTDHGLRMATTSGTEEALRRRWGSADLVVMVLAARHESRRPGNINMLTTELPRERSESGDTVPDRLAGLPHRVVVYTVEGASFEPGSGLSPDVAASAHLLADHVARQITVVAADQPSLPDQRSRPGKNVIDWPTDTGRTTLPAARGW